MNSFRLLLFGPGKRFPNAIGPGDRIDVRPSWKE
jgi:hypothetical protein